MQITDIFIKRPVLATVISLLILLLGIRAMVELQVRQYPFTQNAIISVTTAYYGADPALIAGFITTPLEHSISAASGIDYLTSSSTQGVSLIQANLRLNYDPNKALNEVNTQVNAVINQLPREAQQPAITIEVGESVDSMYIGFYSTVLPRNKISDYLVRVVQPKLQAIYGVKKAEILGLRQFAMRAWLEPSKMAAYNITAADVYAALAANDYISAVGRTAGQMITVNLTAETGLHSEAEFRNLIIRSKNDAILRLKDVATVSLSSEDFDTEVSFDGKTAVYIGIKVSPDANLLTVIEEVRKQFPSIEQQLPEGINAKIVYDASRYVNNSIYEVEKTLVEALIIVTIVIFLFLGSLRSVIIPVIAIPLSLIGTFLIMLMLGYSINLLTLLALVLAIGLVVDDAIIIVENISRHMEEGMSKLEASLLGARELANPIIAISIVLIAVYIPIGFMQGLTGALFAEFAFTLAGSVAISAIVALTLSPMMCSKMLKTSHGNGDDDRFRLFIDNSFEKLRQKYQHVLHNSLNHLPVTIVFSIVIFLSIYALYSSANNELAPQEDQGIIISSLTTTPNSTLKQTQLYSRQVYEAFITYPETDHVFQLDGITGLNSSIGGMVLTPWSERTRTTNELQGDVQTKLSQISGANVAVFQPPSLPGARGFPVQFVIGTTESYANLYQVANDILAKARQTHMFMFLDTDLKIDKLQANVKFDRDKASSLGLTMQHIGNVLSANLSNGYINYFSFADKSYKVIPQVIQTERLNYSQLLNYSIANINGEPIPLSSIATIETSVVPQSLNHFQQLNSATISGVQYPGVTVGQALKTLKNIAATSLPQGYSIDYSGQLRQYVQESSALAMTFVFALLIIFLTLAALFESFRDPLIVLISVPMSIFGAMIFISLGFGGLSLNIYTQVGLVTLIGLISKHGILIVQFANDLQEEGKSLREAIEMATQIRLRPILMTTAAMILGVVPLITATGAGAISRFNIGVVIASGIAIGTLFTLFVVPAMYLLLAEDLSKKAKVV